MRCQTFCFILISTPVFVAYVYTCIVYCIIRFTCTYRKAFLLKIVQGCCYITCLMMFKLSEESVSFRIILGTARFDEWLEFMFAVLGMKCLIIDSQYHCIHQHLEDK